MRRGLLKGGIELKLLMKWHPASKGAPRALTMFVTCENAQARHDPSSSAK